MTFAFLGGRLEDDPIDTDSDDASAVHRQILDYILARLRDGAPANPELEARSLSGMGFDSLSLAETILEVSRQNGIPGERVCHFFDISLEGNTDKFSPLLRRVFILAEHFTASERRAILITGLAGDPSEIQPIRARFDSVSFVFKLCAAVRSLKDQKGHEAHDLVIDYVQPDPGWD